MRDRTIFSFRRASVSGHYLLNRYEKHYTRLFLYQLFTARRSYASAVLGVVILSVRLSVRLCITRVR